MPHGLFINCSKFDVCNVYAVFFVFFVSFVFSTFDDPVMHISYCTLSDFNQWFEFFVKRHKKNRKQNDNERKTNKICISAVLLRDFLFHDSHFSYEWEYWELRTVCCYISKKWKFNEKNSKNCFQRNLLCNFWCKMISCDIWNFKITNAVHQVPSTKFEYCCIHRMNFIASFISTNQRNIHKIYSLFIWWSLGDTVVAFHRQKFYLAYW